MSYVERRTFRHAGKCFHVTGYRRSTMGLETVEPISDSRIQSRLIELATGKRPSQRFQPWVTRE